LSTLSKLGLLAFILPLLPRRQSSGLRQMKHAFVFEANSYSSAQAIWVT
jgi:hypothetical protein